MFDTWNNNFKIKVDHLQSWSWPEKWTVDQKLCIPQCTFSNGIYCCYLAKPIHVSYLCIYCITASRCKVTIRRWRGASFRTWTVSFDKCCTPGLHGWLKAPPQLVQPLYTTPLAFPVRARETGQSWQAAPSLITNSRWEAWIHLCTMCVCVCTCRRKVFINPPQQVPGSLQACV